VENNIITVTKGDSGSISLNFENADGSCYEPNEGEVIFCVKKRKERYCPVVLEKRGCEISFDSNDTKIPTGEYFYDVVIKRSTAEVYTAIEGKFIVRKAVHE